MVIPGEEEVLKYLKKYNNSIKYWEFDEILDLHIEQEYDYNLCKNVYNGEFVVFDGLNKLKIEMKGIHGDIKVFIGGHLEGFCIEDCKSKGFESDNRYHLTDFENQSDFSIYCSELYVSLVM